MSDTIKEFSNPIIGEDGKSLHLSGKCDYNSCENIVHVNSTDEYTDKVCVVCFKKYCIEHISTSGEQRVWTFCTFENGGGDHPVFICGECRPNIEKYDIDLPFRC